MIDTKEEQEYREIKRLAQKLHIPIPEAFLTLEVFDKNGKLIQKHKQRSHSWTRNAYNALFSLMAGKDLDDAGNFGAGYLSLKNTGGLIKTGDYPFAIPDTVDSTLHGFRAPAGQDWWGIQVGSSDTAESFEDYVLGTQINDGTGTGDLSYIESDEHSITWTGGTLTFKNDLVRYFNNNSGASIDVKEVALVSYATYPFSGYTVFSRDKLASTVAVPDTGQLKVSYTIELTYPA